MLAALLVAPAVAHAHDAYVANEIDGDVSVIDTATNTVAGPDIDVGATPAAIAITPDGSRAYVVNAGGDDVSVIDTATNTVTGPDIAVGSGPVAIAVAPDGARAYVANGGANDVSVIDTATNTLARSDIAVGAGPVAIAITPAGSTAYVANAFDDDVSVIDTATNALAGPDIAVGALPGAIAITPNGARAYVVNVADDDVSVIDLATNTLAGPDIAVGDNPVAIAITSDGARAYVANAFDDDVSVIDTATNTLAGPDIAVGDFPRAIAITPNGARAYVVNAFDDDASVIDTATNALAGPDIAVGDLPRAIAIVPNQPPVAELAADSLTASVGDPVAFDASASSDDEGIASYRFDFGDGSFASSDDPARTHAYADPGTYDATVTVDDGEGCPGFVFTGQTASCNGPSEVASDPVGVGVRAFRLRVTIERPQRSLRRITATATCSLECQARARGVLAVKSPGRARTPFRLAPATAALSAGTRTDLAAGVPPNARSAARQALAAGGWARARIRVIATAGERGLKRLRVAGVRP
jgi:YVTN family beta-propeller protein